MVSGEYKTLKKFVESLSHIKQFWIFQFFFISIFCTQYCDLKLNIRKIYFACIKKILQCINCIINVIGIGSLSYLYHQKQVIFRKTSNKHHIYFSLLKKYKMIIIRNVHWAWIVWASVKGSWYEKQAWQEAINFEGNDRARITCILNGPMSNE